MKIKLVRQEEFDNFKDANSLKIAKLEKELQNYKSTMANINVNQEVKQSVSGYGSVSLPKNTANGQVSVSVKGETYTNLLGTRGNTTFTALARLVGGRNPAFIDGLNLPQDRYLMFYEVTSTSLTGKENTPFVNNVANNDPNGLKKNKTIGRKVWKIDIMEDINRIGWWIYETEEDVVIKDLMIIKATDEDWNLAEEELLQKYKYINNTKSTISASRLKSVDKDGIQESTLYLPNVGELRSLPNGVCDEVRVNGGKAEKVQRVSDTMEELAEPITTPIEVNGTLLSYPSGTVYVEKVLPVAGIYTDEITIAHTDFPISSLDKISKIDFATGVETQLDVSKAVVATDKLSFTHTDLISGDIVFFEYFYANESTQGKLKLEYYDSRHVLKDSVTGKFYKIIPTVANGVLTNGLLEV